jgi:carbon monoxide dehydrogenase subunit G
MHLTARYVVDAPIARVWDLLMDPVAIAACLPGCQEMRDLGEDRYQAELVVALAAITGNYGATVAIEEKVPPRSYRLVVQGSGRSGFVKGTATVTLEPVEAGTAVAIDATGQVGGLIARVGQRLLDGVARSMMNKFFACMAARLAPADDS